MQYRAEIDGLRAIAVIPVILFHAKVSLFGGGYVGVDIFFVISGYLITSIILSDLEQGCFSLANFYERRVRRILPALFFVITVTIPFAFLWLTPSHIEDYAESLASVSVFSSNFLFWQESSYFDTTSGHEPLLHTWSLAVEEQFYLLFPLVLMLAWRNGITLVTSLLTALFLISLISAHWASSRYQAMAFYLLPTRFWELLLGALAALGMKNYDLKKVNPLTHQFLSMFGMSLILFAILTFDEITPNPSLNTLIPTVGALLVILSAQKGTIVNSLLRSKYVVGIGLLSYSAYLWHQPLIAFARYRYGNLANFPEIILCVIAAIFPLSLFTYKFIESKFRSNASRKILLIFCGAIFCISFIPLLVTLNQSNPYQYAGEKLDWGNDVSTENISVILYGDSHAVQYYRAISNNFGGESVKLITSPHCMSLPGIVNPDAHSLGECITNLEALRRSMLLPDEVPLLIIAYRYAKSLVSVDSWSKIGHLLQDRTAIEAMVDSLNSLISELPTEARVVVIGNVPSAHVASADMKNGYEKCMSFKYADCPTIYPRNMAENIELNRALKVWSAKFDNVTFVDPADALCDETTCYILIDNHPVYSDYAHLTNFGADKVISLFAHR